MNSIERNPSIAAAVKPHLEPGETLRHVAFGNWQLPVWVFGPLMVLALLPGAIVFVLTARQYLFCLTDRRLIVLLVKGWPTNLKVRKVWSYGLGALPAITSEKQARYHWFVISDPKRTVKARMYQSAYPGNGQEAASIIDALARAKEDAEPQRAQGIGESTASR